MKAYNQILKSAAILGSARVMTMLVGMGKVKILALILGPTGVGIVGIFEMIVQTAIHLTGLGTSMSGVRQIALNRASGNPDDAVRTARTLHRLAFVLGSLGMIVVAVFANPVSKITFNTDAYARPIAILAPTVLFMSLFFGCRSVLQGMQRITSLAKLTITSACINAIVMPLIIWQLGETGIPYACVFSAAMTFLVARLFERKINFQKVRMSWTETIQNSPAFIKLGIGLSNAILLSSLVTYATRAYIARELGLEAVGIYLCAFFLSGKFTGFLLDTMQNDFYPRLSAESNNHQNLNTLVNQQTEIVLLLSLPGLLLTLSLAPWLVSILYSSEFSSAIDLIRIYMLGCFFRVIWAPMGFVRLAKGKGLLFFTSEAALNVVHLALIILLATMHGLKGIAIAYVAHNLIQLVTLYTISHKLTQFSWSKNVFKLFTLFAIMTMLCVFGSLHIKETTATAAGLIITTIISLFNLRQLIQLLAEDHKITKFACKFSIVKRLLT